MWIRLINKPFYGLIALNILLSPVSASDDTSWFDKVFNDHLAHRGFKEISQCALNVSIFAPRAGQASIARAKEVLRPSKRAEAEYQKSLDKRKKDGVDISQLPSKPSDSFKRALSDNPWLIQYMDQLIDFTEWKPVTTEQGQMGWIAGGFSRFMTEVALFVPHDGKELGLNLYVVHDGMKPAVFQDEILAKSKFEERRSDVRGRRPQYHYDFRRATTASPEPLQFYSTLVGLQEADFRSGLAPEILEKIFKGRRGER